MAAKNTTFDADVTLYDNVTASRSGRDLEDPLFIVGQQVRLVEDIVNDGTYPHARIGTLMMPKGSVGYVKEVGEFLQVIRVYEVHFFGTDMEVEIVGCREHELEATDEYLVDEETLDREAMKAHHEKMAKLREEKQS